MSFTVELIAERVFETRDEAQTFARDLANRWTSMGRWRVVEADAPNSHTALGASPATPSRPRPFTLTFGPITRQYRPLCTTAPLAYDIGTSITLVTGAAGTIEGFLNGDLLLSNQKQMPARLVLVEANHLFEWHRENYASGLYASAEPDPDVFGESEVAAELLRRLDRGTPSEL